VAHSVGHAQASDTALTLGRGPTMHSRERGYIKESEVEKGSEGREDDAKQERKRIPSGRPYSFIFICNHLDSSLILPSRHSTFPYPTLNHNTIFRTKKNGSRTIFPRHARLYALAARRV
jgi:hypothetical protein